MQIDPWFSNTAALADFVIAPSMPLEQTDFTQLPLDVMSVMSAGYGLADSYANVTSAVATPPPGSDVLDEWEFFYELAKAMGLPLVVRKQPPGTPIGPFEIDMQERPSTEHLLEILATGSRVPLDEVRRRGGDLYPDPPRIVEPAEPDWSGRADVGNESMMAALDCVNLGDGPVDLGGGDRPFRLVPRRVQFAYNSSHDPDAAQENRANPAYMNPDDMAQLGISAGDTIVLESDEGRASVEVVADRFLRPGVVSLTHCYGGLPGDEAAIGVNANLLVGLAELQDFSGQPRMSDVPVSVYATATGER